MAKHNTNFRTDLKNLSELAFSVLTENANEVINGGAAYIGGDVEHDWASHIKAPPFGESIKKILHHNLTEEGIVEEYYVEHNGKLVGLLAEDVTVIKEAGHKKKKASDEETDAEKKKHKKGAIKDDDAHIKALEKDKEYEEDEETVVSSAHGARPKLIGVPILR